MVDSKMMDDKHFFRLAAEEAEGATCQRARCGSVVVAKDGALIGRGNNSPPLDDESQRMCDAKLDLTSKPKYDKTCCVHAEWNAILDACKSHPEKIKGSTLYFMRVDDKGGFTDAGEPFCTVCSRLALQSGVGHFALWNGASPKTYDARDYNLASYAYYRSE